MFRRHFHSRADCRTVRTAGCRAVVGAFVICLAAVLLSAGVVKAAEETAYEANLVKGVFLTKFVSFLDWPESTFPSPSSPVTIGIIGEDPFGPVFEAALSKEVANGRRFLLKRFAEPSEISNCQILFVSRSMTKSLPKILKVTSGRPVLIVGDEERFAHRGGMVNFVQEAGRLRFEVNIGAVEASGLKVSAKLLQVAKTVKTDLTKGGEQ